MSLTHDYLNKAVQDIFKYPSIRPFQEQVITSLLNSKRDVFCIIATSGGKSLCYQLPPLITNQIAIVISPLISLMTDQKINLDKLGIRSYCYNSIIENWDTDYNNILKGVYKIIYITPEAIINCHQFLSNINKFVGICCIAIDESHCVSMWGDTFRPSYTQLKCLKDWFPQIPMLALTGSVTSKIKDSIITSLNLKDPLIVQGSSNRSNLSYYIYLKTDPLSDILPYMKSDESIIIYCRKRLDTEQISTLLNQKGFLTQAYHAKKSDKERKEIHTDFIANKIRCIVATISFGMGIDKPDIRKVIHYGCPNDLESYIQEVGRAGRDGQLSQCLLFYRPKDLLLNRFHIKDMNEGMVRDEKIRRLQFMEKYIYTTTCRRNFLLSYFDDLPQKSDICCDNCSQTLSRIRKDITKEIQLILSLIQWLYQNHKKSYGKTMYINILYGKKVKTIPVAYKELTYYGSLKYYGLEPLKNLFIKLIHDDFLQEQHIQGHMGSILFLTSLGQEWIKDVSHTYFIEESSQPNITSKSKSKSSAISIQTLKSIQSQPIQPQVKLIIKPMNQLNMMEPLNFVPIQENRNIKINEINKPMIDLSQPLNFIPIKMSQPVKMVSIQIPQLVNYGSGQSLNCESRQVEIIQLNDLVGKSENKDKNWSSTIRETYNLFMMGKKCGEIAKERDLKEATIEGHLAKIIESGEKLNLEQLDFSRELYDHILEIINSSEISGDTTKLKPIRDKCHKKVKYSHIKYTIAFSQSGLLDG